jgi:hypothetical protein
MGVEFTKSHPIPSGWVDIAKVEWLGEILVSNSQASHFWCIVTTIQYICLVVWLSLDESLEDTVKFSGLVASGKIW